MLILILFFKTNNLKGKHDILKKTSPFFTNITLLVESEQKSDISDRITPNKLDFLMHNYNKIESFYQNILNIIYLKNRFLLIVSFNL